MLMRGRPLSVLHVAALDDQPALETLRRTAAVIAGEGLGQVLLALDEGRGADAAWQTAIPAEVSQLSCARFSLLTKVRTLQLELRKLSRQRPAYAIHLHGLTACRLGWRALKDSPPAGLVLYSPHSTSFRLPWQGIFLRRALRSAGAAVRCTALAGSASEAHSLSRLLKRSVEALPHPVSEVFFHCAREQARPAAIVVDGGDAQAADMASRLCVLLNSREARVAFSWLGRTDGDSAAKLRAANVEVLDTADDAARARALSRASLFLDTSPQDRMPHTVAQAMAAGVPCLVSDTPAHRAVIRHGETGCVCASERDFVEKAIVLLRDRAEARRLGEAARSDAARRFTLRHFETAVLRAYGLPWRKPMRAGVDLAAAPAPAAQVAPAV